GGAARCAAPAGDVPGRGRRGLTETLGARTPRCGLGARWPAPVAPDLADTRAGSRGTWLAFLGAWSRGRQGWTQQRARAGSRGHRRGRLGGPVRRLRHLERLLRDELP